MKCPEGMGISFTKDLGSFLEMKSLAQHDCIDVNVSLH